MILCSSEIIVALTTNYVVFTRRSLRSVSGDQTTHIRILESLALVDKRRKVLNEPIGTN